VPTVRNLATYEERLALTEPGRIGARFKHAKTRVTKIADGAPALSRSQLVELAEILLTAAGDPGE